MPSLHPTWRLGTVGYAAIPKVRGSTPELSSKWCGLVATNGRRRAVGTRPAMQICSRVCLFWLPLFSNRGPKAAAVASILSLALDSPFSVFAKDRAPAPGYRRLRFSCFFSVLLHSLPGRPALDRDLVNFAFCREFCAQRATSEALPRVRRMRRRRAPCTHPSPASIPAPYHAMPGGAPKAGVSVRAKREARLVVCVSHPLGFRERKLPFFLTADDLWIQSPLADRMAAPLLGRPPAVSNRGPSLMHPEPAGQRPIGHTAVSTRTACSYWTSTQHTIAPG